MTRSPTIPPSPQPCRQGLDFLHSIQTKRSNDCQPSREARAAWADDFPEKFEVLRKIGEGSFGTVWTGRSRRDGGQDTHDGSDSKEQQEDDDLVALKRINPTCSPSRILNEFEQMRKLGGGDLIVSPSITGRCNVVAVQGVSRTPGGAFVLVMPFFEHDEFRQYMKTLTLSGVALYMRSLLTALAHVHANGIIHRDIKPRNFMYNARSQQGLLIDFGLAEPAEKWMHRSQALAQHRDTKANKRNRSATLTGTDTISERVGQKACRRRSDSGATGESTENVVTNTPKNDRGSVSRIDRVKQENNGETFIEAKRKGEPKGDRAAKVLRKVERGGTTGFRAPEVLWHSRDQDSSAPTLYQAFGITVDGAFRQGVLGYMSVEASEPAVDIWSAGVILLCLLSRRYPLFPVADNDEMALLQIAALFGSGELVRAACDSGRCEIAEFPAQGRASLEGLCSPLLGGGGTVRDNDQEERARADALCLLKGMLTLEPRERITAKDALHHPFVAEA